MSKPSLVVAIVEDERHKMLVYRYFKLRGLSPHQITVNPSPSGQGSAEQWVRGIYASEVTAHRIRSARGTVELVIVIDADSQTVSGRLMQLQRALDENGVEQVGPNEKIARLIPKRNIETWVLCLNEQIVNEVTDYKGTRDGWNGLIPAASETLWRWTRANAVLPNHCIDSLLQGVAELKRLES